MANESIIKAAGAAYAPNPGQYDLSGFIQGITAVAGGLVKRQQEVAKAMPVTKDTKEQTKVGAMYPPH